MCVQEANLEKVAKSCTAQIKGSIFLKINQNYFPHICPEYGFRVNMLPASFPATVNNHAVVDNVKLPEHISNTCCACTYFLKLQHMHIRNDLLQNDVTSRK